eukprot:7215351-Alexandrium_andersonii.AAC.1
MSRISTATESDTTLRTRSSEQIPSNTDQEEFAPTAGRGQGGDPDVSRQLPTNARRAARPVPASPSQEPLFPAPAPQPPLLVRATSFTAATGVSIGNGTARPFIKDKTFQFASSST